MVQSIIEKDIENIAKLSEGEWFPLDQLHFFEIEGQGKKLGYYKTVEE